MKKILFVIFIICAIIACEKTTDESSTQEFCWECITTQITSTSPSVTGYPQTIKVTSQHCGLTQAEINDVQEQLTTTTTSTVSGYKITIKSTAKCTKK